MKLSIIIVNYNGKHFLDDCFNSITEHVSFEHELIVVDNDSSDGSAEYLRNNYPDVKLIVSEKNMRFAGGNNLAVRSARGKYLLLLNTDTMLLNDLSVAVELMEKDDSIGAMGARMLDKDKKYRYSAGYFPEPWRLIKISWLYNKSGDFKHGTFSKDRKLYTVDWVEGSFLLTPLEVWRKVGGLDETYFMYIEDVDYARMVVDIGKRVVYCPLVSYVHLGGFNESRIGMLVRGCRRYHEKYSIGVKRLFANLILDLGFIVRGILYFFYGFLDSSKFKKAKWCILALKRAQ